MNRTRVASPSILLVFVVLVGLYHFFGYTGHFGFDDLHYAELASELLQGRINYEDHYAYRFPVIIFTSLFYGFFGISDSSSSLPAMMITFTILIIVFNILRYKGPTVTIIGLSLCAFSNWFLFYSDKLMPDIYVALSVIWALAIINRYKYKSDKSRTVLYAFLLAFSLLFGLMSKGTIVLILPLLLFLVITDIIRKRDLKFWFFSAIIGIGLLGLYFFIIWLLTGDLMKRFEVIADNSYLNPCSYDQQSLKILLKRIFLGFFELSIFQTLATGFIFVFAILFQKRSLRYFSLDDSFSFFLVSAAILFLSSNFMTISPTTYAPMCLDPRHYLFLIPVAAIPASKIISDFFTFKKAAIQIIIILFCLTIISYFLKGSSFWKLYLPLFVIFTFYYFTGINKRYLHLFIILFAIILLLIPIEMITYAQQVKYRKQRKTITEQVLENNKDCTVISNEVQTRLLEYYSGFNIDQSCRFLSYEEFEADAATGGTKLLLLNAHTRYLSGMSHKDLPNYARFISPKNELIFENKELNIALYELTEFTKPGHSQSVSLSTMNDFENAVPFWKQDEQDLSTDIKYAGAKSNRVPQFSSTFEYPLDSLRGGGDSPDLLIQCSLFCYAEDKTSTKVIVSLENSESTYFWEALEINSYLRAYSNWWPVSFNVPILQKDFQKDSRLKIYVWNDDNQTVYIDNFNIEISNTPVF